MGNNKLAIGFTAVAIIGIGAGAAVLAINSQKNNATDTESGQLTTTTTPTGSSTPSNGNSTTSYRDGNYNAEGQYFSPGGLQKISMNMTIKDGVVSALSLTEKSSDRESKQYQQKFISGVNSLVVGKKLDEVSVSRVSGSSLTSQGFNEALNKVKSQARQN